MKTVEKKAARLVNTGAVHVDYYRVEWGIIAYAVGTVTSDHGKYVVTLEPDRDSCDCQHGFAQPGHSHSHTIAMRLAVWKQANAEIERTKNDE